MPKLTEELQFPSLNSIVKPKEGFALYNSNGVLKILHADGTEKIVATGSLDDLDININFENYYTKAQVDDLFAGLGPGFEVIILETSELPSAGEKDKLYLLPNDTAYDEYLYIGGNWELVGTTKVDLSNYYTINQTKTEINTTLMNYYTKSEAETLAANSGKVIFRTWTED